MLNILVKENWNFIFDRTVFVSAATLIPILGVTWIFGLLIINGSTEVFAWIFAILNSLQVCGFCVNDGMFIFMIIGLLHIFLLCSKARKG